MESRKRSAKALLDWLKARVKYLSMWSEKVEPRRLIQPWLMPVRMRWLKAGPSVRGSLLLAHSKAEAKVGVIWRVRGAS